MAKILVKVCRDCGERFRVDLEAHRALRFRQLPTRCPACLDRRQGNDENHVTLERRMVAEFPAVAVRLSADLFRPGDTLKWNIKRRERGGKGPLHTLKAVIKGASLPGWQGEHWSGRIDIAVLAEAVPAVARVRVMEVRKASTRKRVEQHLHRPGGPQEVEVEYPAQYQYLSFEPAKEGVEATAELVLTDVAAELDASQVLWSVPLSYSRVNGAIAIMDNGYRKSLDGPVALALRAAIARGADHCQ